MYDHVSERACKCAIMLASEHVSEYMRVSEYMNERNRKGTSVFFRVCLM